MIQTLSEVNIHDVTTGKEYFPSPPAWEDQVIYFLLPDRFSNGEERDYRDIDGSPVATGKIPLYQKDDRNTATTEDEKRLWREAGARWIGGNIKGITSKIGYLKRMGITAIWVGPIFKQVEFEPTYHGYGIQNFLEIDKNFGTIQEFQEMVETAHKNGIYVILDIIINHTGNIFSYESNSCRCHDNNKCFACWDGNPYPVKGYNDAFGIPSIPFEPIDLQQPFWPNNAVWPHEFQKPDVYTRKGSIKNFDYFPEYLEGDFFSLKDIHLGDGSIDNYQPSEALKALTKIYMYWIGLTNIDGFRIDTVKHMDKGAVRYFTAVIHEFTQSIGKENFYMIAEITGDRKSAFETLEETGPNAALGLADVQDKLEYLVKGERDPREYFELFTNSILVGKESHIWFRNKVVTSMDDHDQVRKGDSKARFCAFLDEDKARPLVLNALALNVTTLGIPCIYYGTEQGFNGEGKGEGSDRYIRETMFGGEFGAFLSRNRHFFNEDNWIYKELAEVLKIRRDRMALRRGRQFLRQISGNGTDFGYPAKYAGKMETIVPWSRIMVDEEILLAVNTDPDQSIHAWVTIDHFLHEVDDRFKCTYCSTEKGKIGEEVKVEDRNGKVLELTVPGGGFVIYEKMREVH